MTSLSWEQFMWFLHIPNVCASDSAPESSWKLHRRNRKCVKREGQSYVNPSIKNPLLCSWPVQSKLQNVSPKHFIWLHGAHWSIIILPRIFRILDNKRWNWWGCRFFLSLLLHKDSSRLDPPFQSGIVLILISLGMFTHSFKIKLTIYNLNMCYEVVTNW